MRVKFEFIKYQALGNDFIIYDELDNSTLPHELKSDISIEICKRHFGIGADGLIVIEKSDIADAKMGLYDLFIKDKKVRDEMLQKFAKLDVGMCGNGLRCMADYLFEKLGKDKVTIETKDGIKEVVKIDRHYNKATMGKLRYKMFEMRKLFNLEYPEDTPLLDLDTYIPGLGKVTYSFVNSGDPHAIIFVKDIENIDIAKYGKTFTENYNLFKYGTNTDLVEVIDQSTIRVRTYEIGVRHETLACGTGSTAAAAVAYLTKRVKSNKVKVIVNGGTLFIEIGENGILYMSGPANPVFKGITYVDIEGEEVQKT